MHEKNSMKYSFIFVFVLCCFTLFGCQSWQSNRQTYSVIEYPHFFGSSFLPVDWLPDMPVMVTVTATHAVYHFSHGDWDLETINHMVEVSEEALKFVQDWLGFNDNERIIVVYCADMDYLREFDEEFADMFLDPSVAGGWYLGNRVVFNMGNDYRAMLYINIHEAVHAYLDIFNIKSDFLVFQTQTGTFDFFEEGLCNVITYKFFQYTGNERFIAEMQDMMFTLNGIEDIFDTSLILHERASGLLCEFSWNLTDYHLLFGIDYNTMGYNIMEHHVLQSYHTAASFIMFLLEIGTREDFLRFYLNTDLLAEIYGMGAEELIELWLLRLEQ
jgi:hypothetical protein